MTAYEETLRRALDAREKEIKELKLKVAELEAQQKSIQQQSEGIVDEFGDVIQIVNIFPAPGWKVFGCAIGQDDKAWFWEISVIGWAVVRSVSTGDDAELHDDEIKLYVYVEGEAQNVEKCRTSNSLAEQLGRGKNQRPR